MSRNLFIFIGPPGSGKGSLSTLLVKNLGWKQLSTGDLCRKHIAERTEIGQQIDFAIKSGKLVDDSLITDMVEQWLSELGSKGEPIILDGFPRTVQQAHALDEILRTKYPFFRVNVIRLLIADEKVLERLLGRYLCQNKKCQAIYSLVKGSVLAPKTPGICDECSSPLMRRQDDSEETIRDRLATYYLHEHKLLDFYVNKGQEVIELNVEKPLNDFFVDFKRLFGLGAE